MLISFKNEYSFLNLMVAFHATSYWRSFQLFSSCVNISLWSWTSIPVSYDVRYYMSTFLLFVEFGAFCVSAFLYFGTLSFQSLNMDFFAEFGL